MSLCDPNKPNTTEWPEPTPGSQVWIVETGDGYRTTDSDTPAAGNGESRGHALADYAAALMSGGDHAE